MLKSRIKHHWLTFKRKKLSPIIAFVVKYALRLLMRTCRQEIEGLSTFLSTAEKSPCILMLWHNRLAAVPEILHKHASNLIFTAVISKSRDGEPLALLTESYKIGRALRVPHNGRHLALAKMIAILKEQKEIIIITPDGPRGPRYQLKPGIVMAARDSEAQIIPFSWQAEKYWTLKTWDKMRLPKPFTTLKIVFGEPISLAENTGKAMDDDIRLLSQALHKIGQDECD